ncbi:hypothetical protein MJO28_016802, partial [Puccinia striiformis f. sp. tritici]
CIYQDKPHHITLRRTHRSTVRNTLQGNCRHSLLVKQIENLLNLNSLLEGDMFVKTCWIILFVLAAVSALHPEAASAPEQSDCLFTPAETIEPEPRKQIYHKGMGIFNFASRKPNFKKHGFTFLTMQTRTMKDLSAWKLKYPDRDEASASATGGTTRKVKAQLPLSSLDEVAGQNIDF